MDRETATDTLVRLHDAGGKRDAGAYGLLAAQFRIVDVDAGGLSAPEIAHRIATLGVARYGVIGHGAGAAAALALALDNPEPVESIVLLAPPAIDDIAIDPEVLSALATPVLALFGTNDDASPPALGDAYGAALASCHVMLVYDAGHDPDLDRPDAVAVVVADFLRRRERFLVTEESGLIHP